MKAIGIICEYNPFHNGHIHHLKKVKEMFPEDVIILVMSSHFMQRGEVSLINKWDKTRIALDHGIDIVIELPFVFATQSADIFAKGAVSLLSEMKVSHIVFGSESNNIKLLEEMVDLQNTEIYQKKVKKFLKEGINYPTALHKAFGLDKKYKIEKPNDLLALSYIKAIKEEKYPITPISIQRTNDYHETNPINSIASATSIRKMLVEGKDISRYVPENTQKYIQKNFFIQNYYPFLKYKILSEMDHLEVYQTVDEGISYCIQKHIINSQSLDELILNIKSKRYTYNRLSRMFVHILCNFTKETASLFQKPEYIRILGFSLKGRRYIKQIKKDTSIPIITKYGDCKSKMLEMEMKSTAVYASILKEDEKIKLIESEYKNHAIQK